MMRSDVRFAWSLLQCKELSCVRTSARIRLTISTSPLIIVIGKGGRIYVSYTYICYVATFHREGIV